MEKYAQSGNIKWSNSPVDMSLNMNPFMWYWCTIMGVLIRNWGCLWSEFSLGCFYIEFLIVIIIIPNYLNWSEKLYNTV
jgi:hypothetical protein